MYSWKKWESETREQRLLRTGEMPKTRCRSVKETGKVGSKKENNRVT